MSYIDKDESGNIVGIYAVQQREGQEFVEGAVLYMPEPTPLEQIRALEATYSDDFIKVQRQLSIRLLLDAACADPAAAGLSRDQVHQFLMAQGKAYAKLVTLEAEVAPLRALIK